MTVSPVFISHDKLGELLSDVLRRGLSCRFQSRGHSMSPFVEDGDVLTVSPPGGSRIGLGSIVVFICPRTGKVVVHRVVGTAGKNFLTRGDNAAEADGTVTRDNILGFVSRIDRNGRKVSLGLGRERLAIGILSRIGLLPSTVREVIPVPRLHRIERTNRRASP